MSIGSVVSLAYMIIYKRRNYDILSAPYSAGIVDVNDTPEDDELVDSTGKIIHDILTIGVPIALGACIMAILNSVDSKLCMNRLQSAAGFSYYQAKVLYGVYGKAQTLFNLPAAFITPLTIAIVPAISGAIARSAKGEAAKISEDSMRISAVISLPMGVGLMVLSEAIMNVLYPNSNAAGPGLLCIMGAASFFVCIVLMENAVLQASGKEKLTMVTMISGGCVKIAVNWFLVARPEINIYGAPVGTLVSYMAMAAQNYAFMCRTLDDRPRLAKVFARPLAASVLMGLTAWAIYGLCARFIGAADWLGTAVCMMIAVIAAVVVYAVSAVCLRAIVREDLELIPGGDRIGRVLHLR